MTQKLGHVFWLPLEVRMMWNQNCDRQCGMFDHIQTTRNVTVTSDIPSGVICLSSDITALKNLLKSILFLFHVLHINLWLKIHDHCWVQRPLNGDTPSTPFSPLQCFSNVFPQKMYSQKSFKMILWYLFKIWRWQLKDSFFFFLDVNFASKNLKKKKNRRNLFF